MTLQLKAILQQQSNNVQIKLKDITGAYSLGNPNGWGTPNANISDVVSVTVGGTYRPGPCYAPEVVISPVTLMSSISYPLPYFLWQTFILTPTLLNMPSANFWDGIYTILLTINTSTVVVSFASATGNFAVGNVITDTTTGKIVGTIVSISQSGATGTMTLTNTLGNIISAGDNFTNGSITAQVGTGNPVYTNNQYTCTIQQLLIPNADCCLGKKLSKIDPYGQCGDRDIEELYGKAFMILMGAKASAGCTQNNSALDSLNYVNKHCGLDCGCGCSG